MLVESSQIPLRLSQTIRRARARVVLKYSQLSSSFFVAAGVPAAVNQCCAQIPYKALRPALPAGPFTARAARMEPGRYGPIVGFPGSPPFSSTSTLKRRTVGAAWAPVEPRPSHPNCAAHAVILAMRPRRAKAA